MHCRWGLPHRKEVRKKRKGAPHCFSHDSQLPSARCHLASYILNQLAGSANGGFGIGSSVQACTKGIWLWGAPLSVQKATPGAPQHLLLLDTEGLQSICQTEGHDAKIFCLAILLSSFFIYNSEKAINNAAIDQLSLVAQLTQRIRVHAEGSAAASSSSTAEAALSAFFPKFVWLLRDFQLELESANGQPMTPSEYLEECLRPQPGKSAAVAEQNATRSAIRSLFNERSCVALPHPTLGTSLPPSALKNLPPLSSLHAGFRAGVTDLKQSLFSSLAPKVLGGRPLNGPMLLRLAESYVTAINDGALPTISTAWQAVITLESTRALSEATQVYASGAKAALSKANFLDEAKWMREHARLHAAALAHFREIAVGEEGSAAGGGGGVAAGGVAAGGGAPSDGFEKQLLAAIDAERVRTEELLASRSASACEQVVSALCDKLASYVREAAKAPPGSVDAASGQQHSERLPALLSELIAAYEAQAAGAGKAKGRAALLGRLLPSVREAMRQLEGALAGAKKEATVGSGRVDGLTRDLDSCRRDLESTRKDLTSVRGQLGEATIRTAELQREVEAKASSALAATGKLTRERDAATHNASRLTSKNEQLSADLAAAVATQRVTEGKLSEVEKSNQRSSDTMGDLRSQLSAANDAVVSLRSQLAAAEAQGEKLRLIKSMERTCLERATSALLAASDCYVCSLCLLAASACCVCSLRAAHCVCSALRAALLVGSAR